jgi:hypothetical protein
MSRPRVLTGLRSHPYLAASLADLPEELRQAVQEASWPTEDISSIFVVPPQSFFKGWFSWRYVPEQALLFMPDGVLHVQGPAEPGQAAQATYLRAVSLLYTQLSLLLLYGRLELAGRVNGVLCRVVVEFNTVGWHLLQPSVHRLLCLAWIQPGNDKPLAESSATAVLAELDQLPLKFSNGLRLDALQPGECLLGFVFQPAIWVLRWGFLRRQVSATTLLALTDQQVIIVEEEKNGQRATYGYIYTFMPRAAITHIEAQPGECWRELLIQLEQGAVTVERRVTLEPETAANWQELWLRCGEKQNTSQGT